MQLKHPKISYFKLLVIIICLFGYTASVGGAESVSPPPDSSSTSAPDSSTSTLEKEKTESKPQDLERLAQWSINYGSFLIDSGKYLEALEAFETAFESSSSEKTKARVILLKAMVMTTFLDNPDDAIILYKQLTSYPKYAENGIYRQGLTLFAQEQYKETIDTLEKYIAQFPGGQYYFQSEILIEQAKSLAGIKKIPAKQQLERPVVRVMLAKKAKTLIVTGKNLSAAEQGKFFWTGKRIELYAEGGKILVKHGDKTSWPSKVQFTDINPISIKHSNKPSKKIRGEILVQAKNNRLQIINRLDIEAYLKSVVPSESYATWPIEALKSQAVAARTYALYQIRHRIKQPYDVLDDERSQAYGGVNREHSKTTSAVIATEGMLLTWKTKKGPRPILAMFSANSGGYTADVKSVFNQSLPYLNAKPDPVSLKGKMSNWERRFSVNDIEKSLAKVGVKVKNIKKFEPVRKGPSGRLIRVRIIHDGRPVVIRTRPVLTRSLKLPEILVNISKDKEYFIFKGNGWGHGVGYSQWGGAGMAKEGKRFQEILSFYYPGAELAKHW
jgi:stage II sporulation protein D